MSADEYVPSEEDFVDSWACAHVTPLDMTAEEAKDAARAFLARVRRDAAREALDGLAEAWESDAQEAAEDGRLSVAARIRSNIAGVVGYRYSRFPEETP